MDDIINEFNSYTKKPVNYLSIQNDIQHNLKNFVKKIYDFTKSQEINRTNNKTSALSELEVNDFDEEQIWQEIELQNTDYWNKVVDEVTESVLSKSSLKFPVALDGKSEDLCSEKNVLNRKQKESQIVENDDDFDEEQEESEENESISSQPKHKKKIKEKKVLKSKIKPSIVDDKFFKLQEMEQFLIREEKIGNNKKKMSTDSDDNDDDDSIDLFNDIDEEEEEDNDVRYFDFFNNEDEPIDNQSTDSHEEMDVDEMESKEFQNEKKSGLKSRKDKKVIFADTNVSSSDDESENSVESDVNNDVNDKNKKKSEFEMRQERLNQTIQRLEDKTLKEAPWQLKGEINAAKRPVNSLLQEVVDFDLTTRPAPIITEETTLTLEDLIKQRIKDKAWDDVLKKEKPVDDQLNFRKAETLDQSKSKISLAQVYEAEYLKQKQALSGEVEEEKEPEIHKEIREDMNKLFSKLDALCHYHYTPKAPQAEVKITGNVPAISMEEVAPVATSDATLLAPEEVKRKQKGELLSKEERSTTDKKRERRKKKMLQKTKGINNPKVTEHRNTKKATEANDKSLKSSKAFFQQLHEDTTSVLKSKKHKNINKSKG